jgi:hypothetical protein
MTIYCAQRRLFYTGLKKKEKKKAVHLRIGPTQAIY